MPKTWIEIDKASLDSNLTTFRTHIGREVKLMAVIKSNGYGHGAPEIIEIAKKHADFFAVDSIDEAMDVKSLVGDVPIMILGYTLKANLKFVIENDFHQVVANLATLEQMKSIAEKLGKTAKVHLKIETGTSRQGIFISDLEKYLDLIRSSEYLDLAGVSTHFANIEDTTDSKFAMKQLALYQEAIRFIDNHGFTNYLKHSASSAATILYPETHFDLVRIGISLYGLWSAPQTLLSSRHFNKDFILKPVMSWKTIVAQIKDLPAGSYVSYGCTEKVEQKTKVAILPIGYRDGFDRKLSKIGEVLIHGKRCRVLGRVCMNMVIVDINHLNNVELEDEVVLLGKQGKEQITAEEIAAKIGTINYEVVTRINWSIVKKVL
ncbi:alanine racemase [Candidatus Falkowbacteria bacterium RIFOXYD2_FULL_35_9]|uniref:Alanine racemase n=1 Tax=Candidatus Falkowbacteria bacterium RIFOXYC2_FULL_36_12 TaxID=1798002 RepID=A0A1F5SYW7_9BACT|nr:MAG: alanine racemase [Candidatus Falkowbacteria bacterium RIFOXYB2_FULL_35_7]OGF31918.1 MAG: alanine racemase [Candidatus Falkowbacteria bacterium RIFOXYC2_FULL_36_12]OGF34011.1 MAG: alanine racemase [Candidatus Falkowbacteria bacterium RIFOXYA2_FULL_35_8]OGF46881.1 MAG: alanine racemase [Candidatus Falkowbacteria bacterium RIFOXYD2_FULL_35_9]